MTQFTFFLTFFLFYVTWNFTALSPLTYSRRSAQPPILLYPQQSAP